ncbi:hypothetical protein E2986_11955 [Frieseomelitta varia]|uniref:Ig-like domain-containing protein n=1 Tax=Frieseomelitta varia TaxID=561572 RepID=A0A833S8R7_9HYME|nr:hypothetical protein E2986_11955 [Frieseomelitta varia]
MLLTIHKHVVVKIPRFSVSHDNQKTWLLHINNVQQDDRGYYMCQLNTNPMMSQVGFLQVVVPPNILDSLSTESTVAVRENQNITLTCKADGYPTPKLMWKREDGQSISINRHYKGERAISSVFRSVKSYVSPRASVPWHFTGESQLLSAVLVGRLIFPISENRWQRWKFHEIRCVYSSAVLRMFAPRCSSQLAQIKRIASRCVVPFMTSSIKYRLVFPSFLPFFFLLFFSFSTLRSRKNGMEKLACNV